VSAPVRVLVAPKDENPYQQFLYKGVAAAGADVRFEGGPTRSQTLNLVLAPLMLVRCRLLGYRILHIHWVFHFSLPWARRSAPVRLVMQWWFWFYLWSAKTLGYRIVWTAHDLLPHDQVFFDDKKARRFLIGRADAVIALSGATAKELTGLGVAGVRVIPFGSYASPYPRTLRRDEARAELGLAPDDVAVLLIGKIERYKGADLLLQAAAGLPSTCPVRVVLAGACTEAAYLATLCELAGKAGPRAIVRLERIPDEEMATYLDSADFAAFPFRAVTNSSSVLLAQSFGLPVLVPNLASLSDLPEETALRYDPRENGLEQALERAADLTDHVRKEMGRAAQAYADSMDWPTVARLHLDLYEELLAR
jgi:glycosyltransferase involved in cell wall biosynthesis